MRDLLILAIAIPGCLLALRRPWIGIIMWVWLSFMNPHRFTYGIAYHFPFAALAAGCTMMGLLFSSEKDSPFKGSPVIWLILFMVWFTLSWLFGLDVEGDYAQWVKIIKIDLMVLLALIALRTKEHIFALAWTATLSIALLGAKGGLFTIKNGGNFLVWGPPGSFIEDNNEFALAIIMTIPLLRFLQLQVQNTKGKYLLTLIMLLCAASAIGSHSRGALLAIVSMTSLLWWRGKNKLRTGIVIGLAGLTILAFMPESWFSRMDTIGDYEHDRSAMGRISAWWTAWNLAWSFPFGVGFNPARADIFAIYSPYPDYVHAAHSIYFQVLGNHGFIGFGIFILILTTTWKTATWVQKNAPQNPTTQWCIDLASMVQVAIAGYMVGGAFLSLAYFDFPYYLMVLVLLTRVWISKKSWENEPPYRKGWIRIPGIASVLPKNK